MNNHIKILINNIPTLLLGLTFVFILFSCSVQKKIESSFMDEYYGKVKSVKTISYEGTDTIFLTMESFNEQGNPLRMEYYIRDYTKPYHLEEFIYDTKGDKIRTMNIEGSDTTIRDHKSSSSIHTSVISVEEKTTNQHIPRDAHTKTWGTIRSSKEKITSAHYYNQQGHLIEIQDVDESGNLIKRTVIELDARGNEIRKSSFKYDTLQYVILQSYDRYSNIVTTQRINRNEPLGEKGFFRYDYDSHHNWINKYVIRKGKEILIEKQVIVYYE
jgi:hypothetical protein